MKKRYTMPKCGVCGRRYRVYLPGVKDDRPLIHICWTSIPGAPQGETATFYYDEE